MNYTTHMRRMALTLAAVACMTVPAQLALAQAAPQQLQLASSATPAVAASSSSAEEPIVPQDAAPQSSFTQPTYAPVEKHSYWHTHGFDLAGLATGRLQQNIDQQGPTTVGQSFDMGFLANIREHPVSWAGIEVDYGYQKYTEHYRVAANQTIDQRLAGYVPLQQHEATAGYVFHIKTPWVQPFVVLGGGGVYFRSSRVQPPAGSGLDQPVGDQWRGTYMANVGFDLTSKRAKNFGIRIQEHSLFYKAPDFYRASLRSNAWVHQAMPAAGFFYRF